MRSYRKAFTLVEMTIVVAIIAICGLMAFSVFVTASSQAKAHRTRAIVAKIDSIIGEKWEAYRTRQVPIRIPPGMSPQAAAQLRLYAIRDLMRMELPDRITDITSNPVVLPARPALSKQYQRTAAASWNNQNEGAECLYLILAATRNEDSNALDWFSPSEIGDTDSDGMKEVLDGWGNPIEFLRWAPGYPQDMSVPDPFDPFLVSGQHFALKPLVWSAGQDKRHGISVNTPVDAMGIPMPYATSSPPNDPYWPQAVMVGAPFSADASDNITNHDLEAK